MIEWRGKPWRRLESRTGRRRLVMVNPENECDVCEYQSVRRFLRVESAAIMAAGGMRIMVSPGVSSDEVEDHLLPFVLRQEAQA